MRIFGLHITTAKRADAERRHFSDLLAGHRFRLRKLSKKIAAERVEHARKERQSVADIKAINDRCLRLADQLNRLRGKGRRR